ncbi:uncharacterized protein LOC129299759 [Prosopis cineraria]|uniref:uncharacterized protein LOC129299759 n=1 Tax=Prosopis cineraria TaxID=364024 RepID=UPI00240F04F2|nr:uncharacterized protein LOC129299759 [Prosopis cineraria]XP_054794201.1 uncharacterized protein LOC129299759 [Prosopis cineraria]
MAEESADLLVAQEVIDSSAVKLRRNSIAKAISGNIEDVVIPRYRRASIGSCHDFCKYGWKHAFEVKEKHFVASRVQRLPLDQSSEADVNGAKTYVTDRRASIGSKPPTKASVVNLRGSVNSEPKISNTFDTNEREMPTKLPESQKQGRNEVPLTRKRTSAVKLKTIIHKKSHSADLPKIIRQGNSSISAKLVGTSLRPASEPVESSSKPVRNSSESIVQPVETSKLVAEQPVEASLKSSIEPLDTSLESIMDPVGVSSISIVEPMEISSKSTPELMETSSKLIGELVETSSVLTVEPMVTSSESIMEPVGTSSILTVEPMVTSSESIMEPVGTSGILALEPMATSSESIMEPGGTSSILTMEPMGTSSALTVEPMVTSSDSVMEPLGTSSISSVKLVGSSSKSCGEFVEIASKPTAEPVEALSKSVAQKEDASSKSTVKKAGASSKSTPKKAGTSSKSTPKKAGASSKSTPNKAGASPKSPAKKVEASPKSPAKKLEASSKSIKKLEAASKSTAKKVETSSKSTAMKEETSMKSTAKVVTSTKSIAKVVTSSKSTAKVGISSKSIVKKAVTSPKSTVKNVEASSTSNSMAGTSSKPTPLKARQMKLPGKHVASLKPNSITTNFVSSMNPSEGSSGQSNSKLKMEKHAASLKVAARKLTTPSSALLPSKSSLTSRVVSVNARKHKSLKIASHLKNQLKTRKYEHKEPGNDEVEEKTLYVIKMEGGNKSLQTDRDAVYGVDFSTQSTSPPKFSSSFQEDKEESEYTTSEGKEDTSFVNLDSELMKNGEPLEAKDIGKPQKVGIVSSEDKGSQISAINFRRGKLVELQSEITSPRRLKFRRATGLGENAMVKSESLRRSFKRRYENGIDRMGTQTGPEKVVLRRQGSRGKRDAHELFNNVIEETANKLAEIRKSKVKALVGAFETIISLQERKPVVKTIG